MWDCIHPFCVEFMFIISSCPLHIHLRIGFLIDQYVSNSSRITFVIAFTILLAAAVVSNIHDIETTYSGNYAVTYSCSVVRPGVFAAGAVLSLVSSILGIIYFTLISANQGDIPSDNPKQGGQGGIAIGEPQFPQKNNNAQELV